MALYKRIYYYYYYYLRFSDVYKNNAAEKIANAFISKRCNRLLHL